MIDVLPQALTEKSSRQVEDDEEEEKMRGDRVSALANHFLYDYSHQRANENEELHRIEAKLREFERETLNQATEEAAIECDLYSRLNKGDAQDAADTLARSIRNLKRGE